MSLFRRVTYRPGIVQAHWGGDDWQHAAVCCRDCGSSIMLRRVGDEFVCTEPEHCEWKRSRGTMIRG